MAATARGTCLRYRIPLLAIFTLMALSGCHKGQSQTPSLESPSKPLLNTLVVVGFRTAITAQGESPELVRNPVTGTAFMSWPVSEAEVNWLTDRLFELLAQDKDRRLVPPGQARGVTGSIMASDAKIGLHPIEILKEVGKAFEADAVLVGEVYRWQERVGTDYGIEKPASVAFDLSLIRSSDGAILWRSNYDKTQKSLFENLFDVSTYVKSGGRWLSARELAGFGLEHLISEMPKR
jgi:hypothetical protein